MAEVRNGEDVSGSADILGDIDSLDGAPVSPGARPVNAPPAAAAPPAQEPVAPPAAEKGRSVRDALTAAFRGEDGAPQGQEAAQPAGQVRDPVTGQFVSPAVAQQSAQQQAQQNVQQFQPPASMSPVEAQQFASLPVETQQYVARTMARVEQDAQRFRGYDSIEQVIGPRRQAWAMNGMSEAQAVNQVLALSDFAGQRPADFIQWFANQQGIDLSTIGEAAPPIDPNVQQMHNELATLRGTVQQFTQAQQQQALNDNINQIATFASEKGTDGKLLRPYFDEIGAAITPYIGNVKAENPGMTNQQVLDEAYTRACWATPAIRAKMQADQEAARLAASRGTAARARVAGSSVNGAPATGAAAPAHAGDGSIRGILKQQFAAGG